MKATNSNTFCLMPFTHKYYDGDFVAPCCVNVDENRKELNSIRKTFIEGSYPDSCNKCFDREKVGETSYRLEYLKRFSDLKFEIDDNYNLLSKPQTFDVRLETTCNFKCTMCGPHLSSKWKEDSDIYNLFVFGGSEYEVEDTSQIRLKNFDKLLEETDGAKSVAIYGGEPFYMKSALILVNKLSKNEENLKNLQLIIGTNAYFKSNNKFLNKIKMFDNNLFIVSIDGYKDVNDYVRYPSNWNNFCNSINILKDIGDISYAVTISCLNLLDWDNIKEFVGEKNNYYMLESPDFLSINSLHPKVINIFYEKSKDDKMKNYVKNFYQYDSKLRDKMLLYLNALDIRRNVNSESILPWCYDE